MSSSTPLISGNSLYTIVDGPSWTEAEANATAHGGYLVAIDSESENKLITSTFNSLSEEDLLWIGLSDSAEEGN